MRVLFDFFINIARWAWGEGTVFTLELPALPTETEKGKDE